MRDPTWIAAELEDLAGGKGDPEADHLRADRLLIDLIRTLASDDRQSASVMVAARWAVSAWERGSEHWWWA